MRKLILTWLYQPLLEKLDIDSNEVYTKMMSNVHTESISSNEEYLFLKGKLDYIDKLKFYITDLINKY